MLEICYVIYFVDSREGDVKKSNTFKSLFGPISFFRPYLANLLPCIVKIAKRTEDQLQVQYNPLFNISLLISVLKAVCHVSGWLQQSQSSTKRISL